MILGKQGKNSTPTSHLLGISRRRSEKRIGYIQKLRLNKKLGRKEKLKEESKSEPTQSS